MKTTFFILLVVEILALLKLGIASDRQDNSDASTLKAFDFFMVLFCSVIFDIVFAIVWVIVRHHH